MTREHSIEDLLNLNKISGITSASEYVAFVSTVNHSERENPAKPSIWIMRRGDGNSIRTISAEHRSFDLVAFSEDGRRLSYVEKENDLNFLCTGTVEGDQNEKVLLPGIAEHLLWSGDYILILMKQPEDESQKNRRENGDDGFFFEENDRFTSIYRYSPGKGFVNLTGDIQVWEFSVCGDLIAFVGSETPSEESWYRSRLYVQNINERVYRNIYDPDPRTITRPRISPDHQSVAVLESHWSDRGVTAGDVIICKTQGGNPENISAGMRRSFTDLAWSEEGTLYSLFTEAGMSGIAKYEKGWADIWKSFGTVHPKFAPEFSYSEGNFFLAFSDPENPPEVFSVNLKGKMRGISSVNSNLRELTPYPCEAVTWKSSDGREIQGLLRSRGKRAPIIVDVHGGPTSCSTADFIDYTTMYAASGYSVLSPNYRGSTGYGREFAESNIGDMGGKDLDDILTGIDHLVGSGKVVTDEIFITGGSYGGFITNLAIAKTDRFRAAASLFGISEWSSFHGTTNIATWDTLYYGRPVYDDPDRSLFSPLAHADSIKTPLLLVQGKEDPCVPAGQSVQMFRFLKEKGKEVRLLIFPREGHGFKEKFRQQMSLRETIRWFDMHKDEGSRKNSTGLPSEG